MLLESNFNHNFKIYIYIYSSHNDFMYVFPSLFVLNDIFIYANSRFIKGNSDWNPFIPTEIKESI